jgi:hypothetical protein
MKAFKKTFARVMDTLALRQERQRHILPRLYDFAHRGYPVDQVLQSEVD